MSETTTDQGQSGARVRKQVTAGAPASASERQRTRQKRRDDARAQRQQEAAVKAAKKVRQEQERASRRAEREAQRAARAQRAQQARFPGTDEDYLDPDDPQTSAQRVADQVLGSFRAHPSTDQLSASMRSAGARYMDSIKRRGFFASMMPQRQAYMEMSELHRAYCGVMGYTALAPLKQGISAQSVIKTLSTTATMWALSKEFRSYVGESAQGSLENLSSALDRTIERRRNSQWEKASSKVGRKIDGGKNVSDRWLSRLEKLKSKADGRQMFTAESAAMTEVALMEDLYVNLRDSEVLGDHPEEVRAAMNERYEYLTDRLYEDVQRDGLSMDEVQEASRRIIGERIASDPSKATMYHELSQGNYYPTSAQRSSQKTWDGTFTNDLGDVVKSGMFRVRQPVSAEQHQVDMSDAMVSDLALSKDPDDLNERLISYVVGSSPSLAADAEHMAPRERRQQFQRSRMMHQNMSDDGLNTSQQKDTYASAFIEAIENLPRVDPQLAQAWNEKFGSVQLLQDMGRMARDETALREHFLSVTTPRQTHTSTPPREASTEREADDEYTMG